MFNKRGGADSPSARQDFVIITLTKT